MSDRKILKFPGPVDKRWDDLHCILIMVFESHGISAEVSHRLLKWIKEHYDLYGRTVGLPLSIKIPGTVSLEDGDKILKSIEIDIGPFVKKWDKALSDVFLIMVKTRIELELEKLKAR
jgi:hypothetical protein